MKLADAQPQKGARLVSKKRVGRGHAAGQGKTSGLGMRGQKSRSGGGVRPGFEGGQTPLYRRLPKLSYFSNPNRVANTEISVGKLAQLPAGTEVTHASLAALKIVSKHGALRVLGTGEITVPLNVTATHFTASARAKIEAAGGTCTES
ncbi:50S ribosomal protein L15 [Anthocerotibacter panamensis]|uniref:50S ribosomal protein L15 n=1 Tax=Anthocerotibacter panamensis TaxID=2857077 RepID=UPI001C405144|nr:50S ribosomal protein L15 [Anthocerotibacter panamensis]